MSRGNPSYISLRNVPSDLGLLATKELIQKTLNDDEAVSSIGYDQTTDGQFMKNVVIAQLRDSSSVTELLSCRCIEVEHQSKLHKILVTKPRLNSIECLLTDQNEVTSLLRNQNQIASLLLNQNQGASFLPNQNQGASFFPNQNQGASLLPNQNQGASLQVGFNSDASHNQRSIFCTRIPPLMFNYQALRNHFERFGSVANIFLPSKKSFAMIDFHDHEAALSAIQSGGRLRQSNLRLKIEWRRERGDTSNYRDVHAGSSGGMSRASNERHEERRGNTITQLLNWNQLLEKERNLFCEPFQRCLMVQNLPSNITFIRLRSYFDNHQLPPGETVGRIIRMRDGILVEFNDQQSAERVLDQRDHVIGSVSLQVIPKVIPPLYDHCFLVEGNFDSLDTLTAWLECSYSTSEFTLECHSENALYLVKFSNPVDYQELLDFAKRTPLQTIKPTLRELTRPDCIMVRGVTPDVSSDLIKVTFMNKSKFGGCIVTLINRNQGSSSAVVYFSDWRDAENVVEKSKGEQLMVGNCQVQVTLWFNHVTRGADTRNMNRHQPRSHSRQSKQPSSATKMFARDLDCDYDVIEFINSSSNHKENLNQEFINLATVNFSEKRAAKLTKGGKFEAENRRPTVRFHPCSKKSDPARFNQVTFEDDCMRILQNYLTKFVTQTGTYNKSNLLALRNSNLWSQAADVIQVEVRENDEAVLVFARWDQSHGGVKMTGLSQEVPQVMRWLTKKCDVAKEKIQFSPEEFLILTELQVYNTLVEKFTNEDVRISCDNASRSLTLKGSAFAVKEAKEETNKRIKSAGVSRMSFLDSNQLSFLKDACDPLSSTSKDVFKGIKRQFRYDNVKGAYCKKLSNLMLSTTGDAEEKMCGLVLSSLKQALQSIGTEMCYSGSEAKRSSVPVASLPTTTNNSASDLPLGSLLSSDHDNTFLHIEPFLSLVYLGEADLNLASKFLSSYVVSREITVQKNFVEVTQSAKWKQLEQDINQGNSGKVRLLKNKAASKLVVVGIKSLLDDAYRQITEHIRDNIIEERKVRVDRAFAMFLKDFPNELQATAHLAGLDWGVKDGDIYLKGKCFAVAKAEAWINDQKDGISVKKIHINEPGMSQYFEHANGKEFLNTTKTLCKCLIFDDETWNSSSDGETYSPRKTDSTTGKTLLSGKIPGTSVTIHVVQHDITEQRCDAIVNTSNEDLELRNAGVSGAILSKGGKTIQLQMNAEKKNNGGKLGVGLAVTTPAGNLPCKKVIHVVGPSWTPSNQKQSRSQLKLCVFSILSECDSNGFKSICIPAISCGVFGGKARECIPIIVKTIRKYIEQQHSTVQEIFLIEKDKKDVLSEFINEASSLTGVDAPAHVAQNFEKTPSASHKYAETPSLPTHHAYPGDGLYARTSQRLAVSLVKGDICNVNSDVIVTSSAPGNFHSCCGSATSKALLAKAGASLQNACKQEAAYANLKAGEVLQTPGFNLNCQEVFHILLNAYNGSNEEEDLNEAIQVCLLTADRKGYIKIVFPAVGTGGMNYPPDLLAMCFKRQFDNFNGNSLQKVTIVLFPSDSATITAFTQVFCATSGDMIVNTPPRTKHQVNSVTLAVKKGDILTSTCDTMICPTSDQYDLSSGQLSKMLLQRSGQQFSIHQPMLLRRSGQQFSIHQPIYQSSIYRVTNGGNLNFRFIIFVPSPNNSGNLTNVLTKVLSFANATLQVKSLALPAISTGNVGLGSTEVAQAMAAAFQNYKATNPQYLRHIEVVIYEAGKLQHFQTAIISSSATIPPPVTHHPSNQSPKIVKSVTAPRRREGPRAPSIIPIQSEVESSLGVTFSLCSNDPNNIEKAKERIKKEIKERSLTKPISSEVISRLTTDEEEEIMRLEKTHNVQVRRKQRVKEELVLSGLKDDVYKACDSANEIIREYKEALTCAEYVIWKYKDTNMSDSVEFAIRTSWKLEKSYKKNEKGTFSMSTTIQGRKRKIFFDFSAMSLSSDIYTSLQLVRKLQHGPFEENASSELPSHWTDMGNNPLELVEVQFNSPEYTQVVGKFTGSGAQFSGRVKLERIQNPTLYKQFLAQKHKVETRMRQRGLTNPVTRELFHGTNGDVCVNIYKDGFDRSHCGKNGTAYGKGVYFATSAQYSQRYVKPGKNGKQHMFLADVITGEFCQGNASLNVAPANPALSTESYDSVVDNTGSPGMFVVFKDASVYPSYILTFN